MECFKISSIRSVETEISKLSLSRTEFNLVQKTFEDPIFVRKVSTSFEDPIFARKFIDGFEDPFFRKSFFDDPVNAIQKLMDRYKVTNVGLGELTRS